MSKTAEEITQNEIADFAGGALDVVQEIARLFPDSALFGSLILYVITQHLPYGVFALFLLETSGLYRIINLIMDSISPRAPIKSPTTSEEKKSYRNCRPGFIAPRIEMERLFMHEGAISMPMFYMAATVAYLLSANLQFTKVLKTMGADWSSRTYVAAASAILLLVLFYIRTIGCSSHLSLIGALLIGAAAGISFWYINSGIFGQEGMNFCGLPYLSDKTDGNNILYTCVPNGIGSS
jgi:hypothetical protein